MLYSKNGKAGILMTYSMVAIDSDMYKQLRKIAEERFDSQTPTDQVIQWLIDYYEMERILRSW